MESTFKCAAVCQSNPFYVFSNVGNGLPPKNCSTAVKDYIDKYAIPIAIILFAFSAPMLFGLIGTFVLCCCGRKYDFNDKFGSKTYA